MALWHTHTERRKEWNKNKQKCANTSSDRSAHVTISRLINRTPGHSSFGHSYGSSKSKLVRAGMCTCEPSPKTNTHSRNCLRTLDLKFIYFHYNKVCWLLPERQHIVFIQFTHSFRRCSMCRRFCFVLAFAGGGSALLSLPSQKHEHEHYMLIPSSVLNFCSVFSLINTHFFSREPLRSTASFHVLVSLVHTVLVAANNKRNKKAKILNRQHNAWLEFTKALVDFISHGWLNECWVSGA